MDCVNFWECGFYIFLSRSRMERNTMGRWRRRNKSARLFVRWGNMDRGDFSYNNSGLYSFMERDRVDRRRVWNKSARLFGRWNHMGCGDFCECAFDDGVCIYCVDFGSDNV